MGGSLFFMLKRDERGLFYFFYVEKGWEGVFLFFFSMLKSDERGFFVGQVHRGVRVGLIN
jgi:hypothetical protein